MNVAAPTASSVLDASRSCLVLIDFQPRLVGALVHSESVLKNARRLASAARLLNVPAYATEQNPEKLGPSDPELASLIDEIFKKMCFSATGTELNDQLRARQAAGHANGGQQLVIAGCEAHICLLQTALQLQDDGGSVFVVSDACSSRTEKNWLAAMDRLGRAGCEIVTTEMVLFEWLSTAEHPHFRAVQALIK